VLYKILLACSLLFYPMQLGDANRYITLVYAYNTSQADSLNIKILHDYNILYDRNHIQRTPFDTVQVNHLVLPTDTIFIWISAYQHNTRCIPLIDSFTGNSYVYIAYGLNFGKPCSKLRT
jgi:hypothetical protein